ncbi:YaaW family protein [Comamonas jiangduensis]|uniref:YaaW family protein n=1 Tax=Comamonas jiangduensis TaxID=1194168 RepID=UPI003BF7C3E9
MTTDTDLKQLLIKADPSDLGILVDHITDSGKGRISMTSSVCDALVAAKNKHTFGTADITLMIDEFQKFGGNTLANILRFGNGVPYKEILFDVAKKMNVSYAGEPSYEELEGKLLDKVMEDCLKNSTEEDLLSIFKELGGIPSNVSGPITMAVVQTLIKSTGFLPYKYAAIIANAVAKSLLGHGLSFATTGGMMRGISAFAGPIGWGLTAIWTAYDLGSPAYRITIPCVIQIAYIRQKLKYEEQQASTYTHVEPIPTTPTTTTANAVPALGTNLKKSLICQKCGTSAYTGKFCSECGTPFTKLLPGT